MTIKQFLGGNVRCIHGLQDSVLEERLTDFYMHRYRPAGQKRSKIVYIELNNARYIYYEQDQSLHKGSKWTERY